jgi:hypothetical protein
MQGKSGQFGLKASTCKLLQNKPELAFRKIQPTEGEPQPVQK